MRNSISIFSIFVQFNDFFSKFFWYIDYNAVAIEAASRLETIGHERSACCETTSARRIVVILMLVELRRKIGKREKVTIGVWIRKTDKLFDFEEFVVVLHRLRLQNVAKVDSRKAHVKLLLQWRKKALRLWLVCNQVNGGVARNAQFRQSQSNVVRSSQTI